MSLRITPGGLNNTGLRIQPWGTFGTGSAPAGDPGGGGGGGGGGSSTTEVYLGSSAFNSVSLGSTAITSIYVGSNKVWGS